LKNDLEKILDMVKNNFENDGFISPALIGNFQGTKKVIMLDFDLNEKKQSFTDNLKKLISRGDLQEYALITEAWSLKTLAENKDLANSWIDQNGSLASHPQRQEIILVQYSSPEGEIHFMCDIIRGINEVNLGDWDKIEMKADPINVASSGIMQSLFSKGRAEWN
jgi:hypothetical protein